MKLSPCICYGFSAYLMLLALASPVSAQPNNDRETMSVEFDFSKRSRINPTPFSNKPQTPASQGVSDPEVLVQPALDETVVKDWTVQFSDGTVRRMMQRWAEEADYQLLWEVPRDFPVEIEMALRSTFRGALLLVAQSLSKTDAPIQISINSEVRVVRVNRLFNSQAR